MAECHLWLERLPLWMGFDKGQPTVDRANQALGRLDGLTTLLPDTIISTIEDGPDVLSVLAYQTGQAE
jgi:hypothetical protein